MNEDTDENIFDDLTEAVEKYCAEQGFESQYDALEHNVNFYDYVGPQDRVDGFASGMYVCVCTPFFLSSFMFVHDIYVS